MQNTAYNARGKREVGRFENSARSCTPDLGYTRHRTNLNFGTILSVSRHPSSRSRISQRTVSVDAQNLRSGDEGKLNETWCSPLYVDGFTHQAFSFQQSQQTIANANSSDQLRHECPTTKSRFYPSVLPFAGHRLCRWIKSFSDQVTGWITVSRIQSRGAVPLPSFVSHCCLASSDFCV